MDPITHSLQFTALQSGKTCYNEYTNRPALLLTAGAMADSCKGANDMESLPRDQFYVYVLARPAKKGAPIGAPFYVGKGKGRRIYEHEQEARSGHKCHKCNIIRKIWRQGGEVQRLIVFTTSDEQEAFDYERQVISMYGMETLANKTAGGDGPSGAIVSIERRRIVGAHLKERWKDPVHRAKMSEFLKSLWEDPEYREHLTAHRRLAWEDQDRRVKTSERLKDYWQDPEYRENHIAKQKARCADPALRARVREEQKARWQDPEYRARMAAARIAGGRRKKREVIE